MNAEKWHRPWYKVVQIWPGQTVTCLHANSPGHIWTTLYFGLIEKVQTLRAVKLKQETEEEENSCTELLGVESSKRIKSSPLKLHPEDVGSMFFRNVETNMLHGGNLPKTFMLATPTTNTRELTYQIYSRSRNDTRNSATVSQLVEISTGTTTVNNSGLVCSTPEIHSKAQVIN